MNTRTVTLIVAAVLALAAGALTIGVLRQYAQPPAVAVSPPKDVLIATQDIPARAKILPEWIVKTQRPTDSVPTDSIDDPKLIEGDISLVTIHKDSVIAQTIVGRPPSDLLTQTIKPGMRAITIPVDKVKEIAGLLQPGDRVDVIAVPARVGNRPPVASTIIRGALVLALNNSTDTAGATPSPDNAGAATVTLGVTPKQANLLTMADLNTTLRLALRSPIEPVRSLPPDDLVFDTGPSSSPEPSLVYQPAPAVPNLSQDISGQFKSYLDAARAKYGLNGQPAASSASAPQVPPVEVIDGSTVVTGQGTK